MRKVNFILGENAAVVKKSAQQFIAKRSIQEYAKVIQHEAG